MRRMQGFSLLELLLAIALLGMILSGLLALMSGTIRFTGAATSTSDATRELSDVTGYVGDRVRAARHIFTSSTVDGAECSVTATLPCFALVAGMIEGAGPAIDRFDFLAYRLVPRSTIGARLKTPSEWADDSTFVLVEQRRTLCSPSTTACAGATNLDATTITGSVTSIVVDGVSLTTTGLVTGTSMPPFTVDGDQVILRFRTAQRTNGQVRFTPATAHAPYTLTVAARNL